MSRAIVCTRTSTGTVNSCLLVTSPITLQCQKEKLVVSPAVNQVVQSLLGRLLRVNRYSQLMSMQLPPSRQVARGRARRVEKDSINYQLELLSLSFSVYCCRQSQL